jgi:hypothetical protein
MRRDLAKLKIAFGRRYANVARLSASGKWLSLKKAVRKGQSTHE